MLAITPLTSGSTDPVDSHQGRMAAEGRTLFLIASQRFPAQRKVGGSQEPVPGLAAADRAAHRMPVRNRALVESQRGQTSRDAYRR